MMKDTCCNIEAPGSGRVLLDRLYASGVDDAKVQLLEGEPYFYINCELSAWNVSQVDIMAGSSMMPFTSTATSAPGACHK